MSFPPYIFEVLLFDLVDDTSSIARIENGMVLFTLNKLTEQTWGQLCSPVMGENLLFFLFMYLKTIPLFMSEGESEYGRSSLLILNFEFMTSR